MDLMKRSLAITAASVTMLASACITDQALWGSCNPAGDPWGTDGHWVLYCDKGEWVPTMTAQEFVDISSGKNVTIGTLPTKPAPTTTSTTDSWSIGSKTSAAIMGGGLLKSVDWQTSTLFTSSLAEFKAGLFCRCVAFLLKINIFSRSIIHPAGVRQHRRRP